MVIMLLYSYDHVLGRVTLTSSVAIGEPVGHPVLGRVRPEFVYPDASPA